MVGLFHVLEWFHFSQDSLYPLGKWTNFNHEKGQFRKESNLPTIVFAMIVAKLISCFERMCGWDIKVVLEYGFPMITYHVITVDIMWSKLLFEIHRLDNRCLLVWNSCTTSSEFHKDPKWDEPQHVIINHYGWTHEQWKKNWLFRV